MSERNRKLPRLKGFDYTTNGAYFATICTANRENIFGEIRNDKMILNHLGKIVEKYWREIPNHFTDVKLDEFVVMPNHIHGIVWIENLAGTIGARVGNENFHSLQTPNCGAKSRSLSSIVRGFKIGVTKWARQNSSIYPVWQKSFFDRVIRDEDELNRIREYIWQNPEKWENSEEKLPLE